MCVYLLCSVVDVLVSEVLHEGGEVFAAIVVVNWSAIEVSARVSNHTVQLTIESSKGNSGKSIWKEGNIDVSNSSHLIKDTVNLAVSIV